MAIRDFSAFNAGLTVAGGTGISGNGAWSAIGLIRPRSQGGTVRPYLSLNNGFSRALTISNDSSTLDPGLIQVSDAVATSVTFPFGTTPPNNAWAVIGLSHAAGTTTPRGHYADGTNTPLHVDASGTFPNIATAIDSVSFANAPSPPSTLYDWWRDNYQGGWAWWTGVTMDDATFNGMVATAQSWFDAGPAAMWLLNQADEATAVADLIGSWDQTNQTDTDAITGSDPAFFNFAVSTAPPAWTYGYEVVIG